MRWINFLRGVIDLDYKHIAGEDIKKGDKLNVHRCYDCDNTIYVKYEPGAKTREIQCSCGTKYSIKHYKNGKGLQRRVK